MPVTTKNSTLKKRNKYRSFKRTRENYYKVFLKNIAHLFHKKVWKNDLTYFSSPEMSTG
jgi:hypothetical protein